VQNVSNVHIPPFLLAAKHAVNRMLDPAIGKGIALISVFAQINSASF
jgi:hypothetical protein